MAGSLFRYSTDSKLLMNFQMKATHKITNQGGRYRRHDQTDLSPPFITYYHHTHIYQH